MASIMLDYGSASDTVPKVEELQDEQMQVEDDSAPDQARGSSSRLYAVPRDEGIEAGARRGPSPLSREEQMALDDATLLGEEEASETPSPPPVEGGSDIRLDTLLVEGLPITQMSTSRLFAYVAHFGAQPLGLEWVDDQRCNVVFPTEEAARLGLEYLCPATNMSTEPLIPLPNLQTILETADEEWDTDVITSLVTPRKAHRVPGKLYNAIERQTAKEMAADAQSGSQESSSLPDDVPEIYREMEEADRRQRLEKPEYVNLSKLRSALFVRHAVKDWDVKPSRAASKSQWYRDHGQEAGKEIVPRLLDVGEVGDSVELFPSSRDATSKRAFGTADLPARPSGSSDSRRGRGADDRRAMMDELDSELDAHVASRENGSDGAAEGVHEQKLEGQMMADLIEGRQGRDGDLLDRLKEGWGGRHHRPSGSSASRWGHDEYERNASDHTRRRDGRGRGRATRDTLDDELDDMADARRGRDRSASPIPREAVDTAAGGRIKMKGRGRMKAPGGGGGSRAWGNDDGGDGSWAEYGTERYGQTKRDRRRKAGGDGDGDLAARLGENRDLLSRMGDADGQTRRLADRFD